jgi:riboflavin kinase
MDRSSRPTIVGEDFVTSPYPVFLKSYIIPGFGRGSSELGIPTANVEQHEFDKLDIGDTGIYYGWAKVEKTDSHDCSHRNESGREVPHTFGSGLDPVDYEVHPMVMSVGWNPFYGNKKRTAEIHIMHKFTNSFYGAILRVVILGYIRPELNYVSKEALIDDINTDITVALKSLDREDYKKYRDDKFFEW